MSTQLSQIAKKAKLDPKARFTSLAHLLTPEFLKETWGKMNRKAAGGVDGQSAEEFGNELEMQIEAICKQLKEGSYQAPPVRRVDIPKGPGNGPSCDRSSRSSTRACTIPCLELANGSNRLCSVRRAKPASRLSEPQTREASPCPRVFPESPPTPRRIALRLHGATAWFAARRGVR